MTENTELGTNWESFVSMLLHRLDIPTKEDINNLHTRLDKLEQLIYQKQPGAKRSAPPRAAKRKSASAIVLEIIANHPKGTNFKTIKAATGFDDKKLRNIIFRLDKIGKIQRVNRGIYKKI
jgi:predicted Rossmann fold nucleotide-binding protein DprA/Smf involved in DNA uptake